MTKLHFLAIPPAAFSDTELSAVDFRVLGAVATHDRMDKNGRGCFAAQSTLAAEAKCDIRSVKRALQHLKERGHIRSEKNDKDARQRVYRLVYPEIGDKPVTYSARDRGQLDAEIGDKVSKNPQHNQGAKGGKHSNKQIVLNEEANTPEGAPSSLREIGAFKNRDGSLNLGGYLAFLERAVKAGDPGISNHMNLLEAIVEQGGDYGDPNIGRAERLLYDIASWVEGQR